MARRPDILLLFSDEHSFRYMGHVPRAEGGEPAETQTFDRLASQATVFSDAYCQMALCTPSRMCLLTGREVRGCGAWTNNSCLRPELASLPGALRDAGYATCLSGKMHLYGTRQFVGFQDRPYGDLTGNAGHQWEPIPDPAVGMRERTSAAVGQTGIPESQLQDQIVCDEALSWIRERHHAEPERPWFCTASFSRPHFPLTAPRRWIERYWPDGVTEPLIPPGGDAWDHPMSVGMREGFQAEAIDRDEMIYARACYFACVSYLDEVLGDFFARCEREGLLDDAIVIYTTDHGELAGEHGVWWKNGWYEGCTRVPLIVSTPAQRRGDDAPRTCRTPVGLTDLFPTLCAMSGTEAPGGLDGADLSGAVDGTGEAPDRPVVCDNLVPRWGPGTEFRMVRRRNHKYVIFRDAPPLAFDLATDPGEQRDLLRRGGGLPDEVVALREFAERSIDFDEAERERTVRDGDLKERYAQAPREEAKNCYHLPGGRVVDADSVLYHPRVVAETPEEIFGEGYREQNPSGRRDEGGR